MKKGYRTTEFWFNLFAILLGLALGSGLLADGSLSYRIVGGAISVLAALGYTVSRSGLKKAELLGEALTRKGLAGSKELGVKETPFS